MVVWTPRSQWGIEAHQEGVRSGISSGLGAHSSTGGGDFPFSELLWQGRRRAALPSPLCTPEQTPWGTSFVLGGETTPLINLGAQCQV